MAVSPSPGAMLRCLYELVMGTRSSDNPADQKAAALAVEQISRQLEQETSSPLPSITSSPPPAAHRVPRPQGPQMPDTSKKRPSAAELPAPIAALVAEAAQKLSPETLAEIPNQKRSLRELRALIRNNQSEWEKNNKGPVTLNKEVSENKKMRNRALMVELYALQTEYRALFQEQQKNTQERIKSSKDR